MGYRSEVVIAVTEDHVDRMSKFLADADKVAKNDFGTYFYFKNVKWYSDYEDVQKTMEALSYIPEDEYGFLRTGEDTDDIECQGNPYDFGLWVNVSLSLPDCLED